MLTFCMKLFVNRFVIQLTFLIDVRYGFKVENLQNFNIYQSLGENGNFGCVGNFFYN